MKLYVASFSPNPRRVRIYLAEKGLASRVEEVKLDLMKGEHLSEAFVRDKNPLGVLPVLELDDGTVLTESMAIMEYLEELHPEPPMFGTTPMERARTREANRIAELGMLQGAAVIFQNVSPFFKGRFEQSEGAVVYGRYWYDRFLGRADQLLAERTWLAGERFTVADVTALCAIDFAAASKVAFDAAAFPNAARWLEAVRERPSCALKKKS